jgi:hypothetical protein
VAVFAVREGPLSPLGTQEAHIQDELLEQCPRNLFYFFSSVEKTSNVSVKMPFFFSDFILSFLHLLTRVYIVCSPSPHPAVLPSSLILLKRKQQIIVKT